MSRFTIDIDEWYPVYVLREPKGYKNEYEVPDELAERWRNATDEFNAVQDELEAILNENGGA